ncbi:putative polysaccharide biosynthesis protein EpsC [Bacillus velezensis]|nr:putative polysaccharide biosynthesis protein EpsC [Bacillus velezensis]
MTYRRRLSMIFALDTYLVLLSVVIGYQFFEDSYHFYDSGALLLTAVSMLISHHVCAFMFHQYKQVWTYTGIGELLALMKGITLSAAVTAAVQYGVFHTILFRLLAVSWMVQLLFIGGSRMISRVLKETIGRKQNDSSRALIIGAGSGGRCSSVSLPRKTISESCLWLLLMMIRQSISLKSWACPSSAEKKALCRRCRG